MHESDNDFLCVLGELGGFITSISFDHFIIGGDFNTDFRSNSFRSSLLPGFLLEHSFVCLDLFCHPQVSITLIGMRLMVLHLG